MAYDEALAERARDSLAKLELKPDETFGEMRMFGGLCMTLYGEMLVGIESKRYIVRLGDAALEDALANGKAEPMTFTGKPLRNFAYLLSPAL